MEDNTTSCPNCHSHLDELGLCPRCLLAKVLDPATTEPSPSLEFAEITRAFPDLEIIELIGQGGMGAVYKCRQKSLDRLVALKILPQSLAKDSAFAEHFQNEAKTLATLNHPNIVTIHDFGRQEEFYFLLMEYVDGPNLRHLIRERLLSPEEALTIIPPLCEALQFAHDHQIVHRDIKPENLLLDSKGRIKVADFGISKIIDHNTSPDLHASGTPAYMAPEQKDQPHTIDARSDIYSLGVVLYEMLTGERPDSALAPPSQKATLDVRIDEVVLRALNSQPDQRWQSATELQTRLETILTEPPAPESLPHSSPKRARWACVLTILSLLFLTLAVLPTNISRSTNSYSKGHISTLKTQRADLLAAKKRLERIEANKLPNDAAENPKNAIAEQAHFAERAEEIQQELNSLTTPKSTFQKNLPIILTIAVLGLAIASAIAGLSLGWRHLSWLRGQTTAKPALLSGMFAALFWPITISAGAVFALLFSSFNSQGWTDQAPYIGLIWAICLAVWIIVRTFAWIKNQPYPLLKNHWFFTIPLIALAILIPISHYHHAQSLQTGETKAQKYEASRTRFLESELTNAFTSHSKTLIDGLDANHPQTKITLSRINSLENNLKSHGEENYLAAKHQALSSVVRFLAANLDAMEIRRVDPQDPERLRLQEALINYKSKLTNLPPIVPAPRPEEPDLVEFLTSFLIGLIPAAIALIIIRKAGALQQTQKS